MNQTSQRRPRRTSEEWADLVSRAEVSPLSVEAFCKQHGVTSTTFYGWRKRLRARAQPKGFVPVRIMHDSALPCAEATAPKTSACIEIVLHNGRIVRIKGELRDEASLQNILRAAEGRSC